MIYKEKLKELYISVSDESKILSQEEINWLAEIGLKEYDDNSFSKTVYCLAFGSKFFEKNPGEIGRILTWDLDDYDLGQVFDAIKYAELSEEYLELLFEYINFERFASDLDCSSTSALNTVSYYIYHSEKEDIYLRLYKEFLKFVKTLDHNNLTKDQQTFFNFFYKVNNPDYSMPPFRSKVGHPFRTKVGHPFRSKVGHFWH